MSNNTRLKYACYTVNVAISVVSNLSPVLFLTFRSLYGISYSLLGLLVTINFVTQFCVDIVFSLFSHKFNIPKCVKMIPVLTVIGLIVYAVWPWIFPNAAYAGLVVGTIIFSASGGFSEVLISPTIASIPSDDPDREMSKLHSIYAWGVVFVIVFSTLFLRFVGNTYWQWLALIFALIPLTSAILFAGCDVPAMATPEKTSGALDMLKNSGVLLCFFAIFVGGAAELVMGQWSSSYLEQALGIPKVWGDIFGVALFSVTLGLGRSLYAKIGKSIGRVLFLGSVGATLCYLVAALSNIPLVGLCACALTGLCVSMLWPGMIIVASDRFPQGGVFIYALMAAGGDFGASVAPQLTGIVTDAVIANPAALELAQTLSLAPEQLGMKLGMLVGMLFPLVGCFLYYRLWKGARE